MSLLDAGRSKGSDMAKGKISKRSVDQVEPGLKDLYLWDTDLAGFGLKVTPAGRKVYLVQYQRGRSSPTQRVTIGPHGTLTPDQARDAASKLLAQVRLGDDPAADRRARRKEKTISELADRYVKEHVKAHNKPSSAADFERIVKTRIKPVLGSIKISDLTRSRIKEWHQEKANAPYAANRELACLSKMMSLAAGDWELREDNPCRGIQKFPEHKRTAFFSDAHLKSIGEALAHLEARGELAPSCARAIRLLAVTGMRLGEVLSLRWADFDAQAGVVRLPDAKAGARTVPLGAPALVLMKAFQEQGTAGPYVCHGSNPKEPLAKTTLHHVWNAVRKAAELPTSRMHDFRHTVGTYAAQAGMNAFLVRDLLGHRTMSMTGRYVERHADPVRVAADAVANRVSAAMAPGGTAEVHNLSEARKGRQKAQRPPKQRARCSGG